MNNQRQLQITYSIKTVLTAARENLKNTSDSPSLDADLLLAHCLDKTRSYLHTWPEKKLSSNQVNCFNNCIQQRMNDFPVAYLLGSQSFWTLDLIVNPNVLIPRPETELLVELALEKLTSINKPKILELGTGSGAIALALASERSDAGILATDNSIKALYVAKENTRNLKLESQIRFLHSNWYSELEINKLKEYNFDLIVSNPPYIEKNDPNLEKTTQFEPQEALLAKNKGMQDIETIIKYGSGYLKQKGWMLIEHGSTQGSLVEQCYIVNGYSKVKKLNDLNGHQRVCLAQSKSDDLLKT